MKKDIKEMDKLFKQLHEITQIDNIAIHEFVEGQLHPVHMFSNGKLSAEQWKNTHNNVHVKIEEDFYLRKIQKGEIVYIEDADKLKDCPDEFKKFNIKTNFVIPLFKNNHTVGMVLTPSIGRVVKLNKGTREKCIELVEEFSKNI
jgi:hypothetical protein